ncbi:hypothetical protein [Dyadobacter flavalbus]|uniref:hypothetical protein n=1 Tax=Dyadobacter flavalbus TaxID=2579942 RepID=UPI0013754F8E|nr:hypothetical protein [Dyadobacter flavalbus]
MTQTEVIEAFDTLPKGQQLIVAREIQLRVADDLFEELDQELPDSDISIEDIQKEITAYRNARKKN